MTVFGGGDGGGGGAVLAVNGETVECRNMSTDCAPNRSQTRCFTMFYYVLLRFFISLVYSYLRYVELSACPFQCGIRVTQKANFHLNIHYEYTKFFCTYSLYFSQPARTHSTTV